MRASSTNSHATTCSTELSGFRRSRPDRAVAGEHVPHRLLRGKSGAAEHGSRRGAELPPLPEVRRYPFPLEFRPLDVSFGHRQIGEAVLRGSVLLHLLHIPKAIDSQDGDNDGTGVAPIQNRGLEKARAGYDRNHRLSITANYELPFGLNKKWATSGWKKYAFGGLEISAIQTFESGNPLTFSYTNSPYNYYPGFAGNSRPDVVSQMEIRDGWVDLGPDRFNKGNSNSVFSGANNGLSNFALPGGCPAVIPAGFDRTQCDFRVGNAGRNIVTGTPLRWTTISAQKNFQFSERWKAQLRWDMQNAFKTFNFNTPDTTVDFRNPQNFGKVTGDPTTASFGGQPLMNLTLMIQF